MNKRILSAAMALSLMAAQAPMMSYAQEASMTEEDLIAALEQAQAGATVELTGSVELSSQLVIEKEIVLDGNGYTITKGEGEDAGPNTNAEGWDNGEFGIKLYEARGGPAPERHRGAGQRRNPGQRRLRDHERHH